VTKIAVVMFRILVKVLPPSSGKLMMEAASTSETSANFYQYKLHNNREDSHIHTRRRENFKSHVIRLVQNKVSGEGQNYVV
jgi:hypothetical protein